MTRGCEQLARSCYAATPQPAVEPVTSWLHVRCHHDIHTSCTVHKIKKTPTLRCGPELWPAYRWLTWCCQTSDKSPASQTASHTHTHTQMRLSTQCGQVDSLTEYFMSHSTQNGSLLRHSFKPISWLSTKETTSKTTKANDTGRKWSKKHEKQT